MYLEREAAGNDGHYIDYTEAWQAFVIWSRFDLRRILSAAPLSHWERSRG